MHWYNRDGAYRRHMLLGRIIAVLALAIIWATTLTPSAVASAIPWWCLWCGPRGGLDLVLNIALFAPLGLGLALAGWPAGRAVLLGFLVTVGIEFLQYTLIPGRDASPGDAIANTVGTAAGVVALRFIPMMLWPQPREALRLAMIGLAGWLVFIVLSYLALQPSQPDGRWFGQLAPRRPGWARYDRPPANPRIGNMPIRWRAYPKTSPLRERWLAGDTLSVGLGAIVPPESFAPAVALFASRGRALVRVGQSGDALVVWLRRRASDWGFSSPTYSLPRALPPDTVTNAWVALFPGSLAYGTSSVEHRVENTPGWSWSIFLPGRPTLPPWTIAIATVWLAIPAAVLLYWAGRSGLRVTVPIAVLFIITCWPILPLIVGWIIGGVAEWTGVGLGLVGGLWLALAPRQRRVPGST